MRRIYKSMIWVSVLALSAGAVSAQKAERKNVREGNKLCLLYTSDAADE